MPPAATPWPELDALSGVAAQVAAARDAIAAVRRLPENRRTWAKTAAAAGIRAARASAMLDGGSAAVTVSESAVSESARSGDAGEHAPELIADPVLAGALRVSAAIGELAAVWGRAPLQALARLHTLAAADLAAEHELGRPRPEVTARLAALAEVVVAAPWSGPVQVAVVYGELLATRPFETANGVVARAAARLTMVTSGLDPQALTAPEVGYLRTQTEAAARMTEFAAGTADGVAGWIGYVCRALETGAREARGVARAAGE